jgi:antitoxin PrlF
MDTFEVTNVSTRGQVVIPSEIREKLNLKTGTKLIVIQDGENILLKPLKKPRMIQFKEIIKRGDDIRKKLGLKEEDIAKAIKKVRKKSASRN